MQIPFQLKLMLIMAVTVIASTWILLSSVRTTLRKSFADAHEERFITQVDNYLAFQRTRLNHIAVWSEEAAQAQATLNALNLGEEDASNSDFLRDLISEVGGPVVGRGGRAPGSNNAGEGASRAVTMAMNRAGMVVFLVDPEGKVLGRDNVRGSDQRRQRLRHFEQIAQHSLSKQDFGIFLAEDPNKEGEQRAVEVVATPVFNPVSGNLQGGIMVGLPLNSAEGRFWQGTNQAGEKPQILAGMYVEDQLISSSIPESISDELRARLAEQLARGTNDSDVSHVPINIDGIPHDVHFTALNPESTLPLAYHVAIFSQEELNAALTKLKNQTTWFAILALAVALSMAWFLSRHMTVPIRRLVTGTKAIAGGDYKMSVPVQTNDEIGELAASFNHMAAELQLRERYRSVLDKVTDKAVAHELMHGELELGGELRFVTVLFCDIRGFTTLTEGMPPGEVVELLNEHMTALTEVVHECDGVVDKFVGDLVMAVFGAPKSYGNDALNAVRCAERMIQERDRLNSETGRELSVGIGLTSGEVLAGCMGSDDRLNYTVLGERVNLAYRLCEHAKAHEVLMDEATSKAVRSEMKVQPVESAKLKGFSQAISMYRLEESPTDDSGGRVSGAQLTGA